MGSGNAAAEWGAMLALVLTTGGQSGQADADVATLREEVTLAQKRHQIAAFHQPPTAALQRPHKDLLRLTEQLARVAKAILRQAELKAKAERSSYGRREMQDYLRGEAQAAQAVAALNAEYQRFAITMQELARNDKELFERLRLPADLFVEQTGPKALPEVSNDADVAATDEGVVSFSVTQEDLQLMSEAAPNDGIIRNLFSTWPNGGQVTLPKREYSALHKWVTAMHEQAWGALGLRYGKPPKLHGPEFLRQGKIANSWFILEARMSSSVEPSGDALKCPNCSRVVAAGDRYCMSCGERLS